MFTTILQSALMNGYSANLKEFDECFRRSVEKSAAGFSILHSQDTKQKEETKEKE